MPLLVDGDSARFVLRRALGTPLGMQSLAGPPEQIDFELPSGSVLLLYTDGLFGPRGEDLESGLARMAEVAAREFRDAADEELESACARIVQQCAPESLSTDDVAVLAFRFRR